MAALGRAKRNDAGTARVFVTRTWDAVVPFTDTVKERIALHLRQYIRGLVQKGEAPSNIRMLAARKLANFTFEAGHPIDAADRARVCHIPKGHVDREAIHRKVRVFDADRKAHEDAKPRIRRTRSGLLPMDIIVGDVHPIDVLITREDGSTTTARAIAWLDFASNRVWIAPVRLEKGEGVRNDHVIASFARMVTAWGMPRALHLDNGSEYNWAAFIDDALKLIDRDGLNRPGFAGGHLDQIMPPFAARRLDVVAVGIGQETGEPVAPDDDEDGLVLTDRPREDRTDRRRQDERDRRHRPRGRAEIEVRAPAVGPPLTARARPSPPSPMPSG